MTDVPALVAAGDLSFIDADALNEWIVAQRWFASKTRQVDHIAIASAVPLRSEAPLFVLSSRKLALETALEVTDLAMKACGGAAFSRQGGAPVERMHRDARAGWVMAPTVDHLDDFIGKALTGLPLF